jgi:hypothetical protein
MNDKEKDTIKILRENLQDDPTANGNQQTETYDLAMISDSTSVTDVIKFVESHTLIGNQSIFGQIENFIGTPIPQEEAAKGIMVNAGLELLHEFNMVFSKAESGVEAVFAKYSIRRGLILLKLKQLVKKAGQSWDAWATIHVPYVSQRTRIDSMRLASRSDCHRYFFLGSERLLMLVRATEHYNVEDPIGEFMTKHGIRFNPHSSKIKKFKWAVDAALNAERLEKVGVTTADSRIVKALTQYVPSMDNNLLMTAKAVVDSNGDINRYFEKLIVGKGKEQNPLEINKVVKDFNTSGTKLIQIIDYMFRNQDTIETLNAEIVIALQEKLAELKKLANIQ